MSHSHVLFVRLFASRWFPGLRLERQPLALIAVLLAAPGVLPAVEPAPIDNRGILPRAHTLTVAVSPVAGGTVGVEPEKRSYSHLEKVTVTARPAEGFFFAGWSELWLPVPLGSDAPQTSATAPALVSTHGNPLTLTMTHSVALVARFQRGAPGPEMEVRGRGIVIAAGDNTPALVDGTDFGLAAVIAAPATGTASGTTAALSSASTQPPPVSATGAAEAVDANGVARWIHPTVRHTFTIRNVGTEPLTLTGNPVVARSGPQAAEFTVVPPAIASLAPGRAVPFDVIFAPAAVGLRTATLAIATNDGGASPYTFAVQGTGGPTLVPFVPAPGQVSVAPFLHAGQFVATVELQFNTGGYRVEWGRAAFEGNTIVLEPRVFQPTGMVTQVITRQSFSYPLGALRSGDFSVVVKISGQGLKTATMAVRTLATAVEPAGAGVVRLTPAPAGNGNYLAGTTVSLHALAAPPFIAVPLPGDANSTAPTSTTAGVQPDGRAIAPRSVFQHWSGDATGTANPVSVKVDANKHATAHFTVPAVEPTAPVIAVAAAPRVVRPGGTATLAVTVRGIGPFIFQWKQNGVALADDAHRHGSTRPTLTLAEARFTDAGSYSVHVADAAGTTTTAEVTELAVVDAQHRLVGTAPAAGGTLEVANTLTYAGAPTALGWQVVLPEGWSYATGGGTEGDIKPAPGTTGVAEWAWSAVPPSPVEFAYTLNVPPGATGEKGVRALVVFRQAAGPAQVLVRPDPLLTPAPASHHSADTNRDLRIGLVELTRVIELYNTRHGTTRTGGYAVATAASEDGFAPEPARSGDAAAAALARFYSADTNRDGRLSLVELTRVIELYNTRNGTARTGQYRAQAGTEDGYAPGP